jgi:PAS domain S-box-containing protein
MQARSELAHLLADARIAALVAAPSPAFLIDSSGRLHFANRSALALLGARTLADAIARGPEALGALAAAARELVATLSPSGAPRLEHLPLPGIDPPIVFAATRFALGATGDAALLIGVDTGRERTLELRLAFAALIDDAPAPLALFDATGRLIHANAAAAARLGSARTLADLDAAAADALARLAHDDAVSVAVAAGRLRLRPIAVGATTAVLGSFVTDFADPKHAAHERVTVEAGSVASAPSPPTTKATSPAPASPPAAAPAPTPTTKAAPPSASLAGRMPSRFVWQMDAEGRFTSVSPDLAAVVGAPSAAIVGLDWPAVAAKLGLGDAAAVAAAVARRDTWSGIHVLWPVAGTAQVRPVDLAALPVFDRERNFLGYRGFGVFHDAVERTAPAAPARAEQTAAPDAAPDARAEEPPRAPLALVEQPENVVPLRTAAPDPLRRPVLTSGERSAFREIARALGARLADGEDESLRGEAPAPAAAGPAESAAPMPAFTRTVVNGERAVLDRLPLGVIVHRGERVLYANRAVLEWTGLANIDALNQAGGLRRLFAGVSVDAQHADEVGRTFAITGRGGEPIPVEARLLSAPWEGESALVYVLRRAGAGLDERLEASELALREAEATARELRAILDTATDGVLLLNREGRVLGMNRSAEALFGFDAAEVEGQVFTMLFAPESKRAAMDYLDGLASNGVASVLNDGREVLGRVREGGLIPLFMTVGRVADSTDKFCAVFRDISQWKRAEQELIAAKREAEKSSSHKSDFLAKVSHEIRTPLNAIIGFAEVMADERFGPVGNQRYREYLKDIQASGAHLISLINDLLDLSKIEAGKLDLTFTSVDLNDIASQCVAIMQSQANRQRIIIRTSLAPHLPPVVADARSMRQIVLNLLSNSIKFTEPGGQVIVSTALSDGGEVTLRVRDTGVGMTETEVKTALEPFRQLATSSRAGSGGSGLGLPLTKALTEANRAGFAIKSAPNSGTLIEIVFPTTRVLAE